MTRSRILVVGAGFAGYHAAKALRRRLPGAAEVSLVNPTDYFLYLPLLPEMAGACSTRGGSPCRSRTPCPTCGWCSAQSSTSTWPAAG